MTRKIDLLILITKLLRFVLPKGYFPFVNGNRVVVRKIPNIMSLAGSLKSDIKLTDRQLRKARGDFEKHWAREM